MKSKTLLYSMLLLPVLQVAQAQKLTIDDLLDAGSGAGGRTGERLSDVARVRTPLVYCMAQREHRKDAYERELTYLDKYLKTAASSETALSNK